MTAPYSSASSAEAFTFSRKDSTSSDLYNRQVLRDGQTLHDLYEERVPLYEKYADVIVDEHHLNVEQTIEKIMELKERFQ